MTLFKLTGQFRGHGTVSTKGGTGHGSAGGGSGGRIGIHSYLHNEFRGSLLSTGEGGTTTGDIGGPGSVFVEDRVTLYTYQSRLYVDGNSLTSPKPLVVWERNPRIVSNNVPIDNGAHLNFDHMMLNRKVDTVHV